ncbi:ABC-type nitrate/sulfonate/bicarbonate transport system, periplasmic component [Synechococcus sp. PCC 7502]|uniref:ABC transporter substrate-binding protein n=1 Tax=Synechococcus sp. PCC 7502 TaxID=1173263 RepID=UPI00029FA888|nr:ABC transporter substrate-binding protein [Synechococcus sp. PCC 7502]AFY74913.1 ABC-type nitrate/sulfonate/bicarbonate transport system, periplasmic component [Synechococcus sp. PCC 7502]
MKLKHLSLSLLTFFLCILGVFCTASYQAQNVAATFQALTSVKVCTSSNSGNQLLVQYAKNKGIFQKYGLNVEVISIESGTEAAVAMIAKSVNFCQIAGSSVINAVIAGEDLVMIAGIFNQYPYAFISVPSIKTPQGLKGKAVAISKSGSSTDAAIRAALKYLKLNPDKDVEIAAVGGEGERLQAMEAGRISATVLSFPLSLKAKNKGYHTLLDMTTLDIPYQHTVIATTRSYIKANPQVTVNFMKAIVEAIATIKKDRKGAIATLVRANKYDPKADAAILEEWYDTTIQKKIAKVPYPTLKGITKMLGDVKVTNPQASKFKAEDTVDISILRNLEKSGFINNLYKPK